MYRVVIHTPAGAVLQTVPCPLGQKGTGEFEVKDEAFSVNTFEVPSEAPWVLIIK